ncbi:Phytochrome C [Arabidopsis thaliana]|uniref:Phytochrome n=4 Tax=Arabidopsis TaxID=3701 RepID=G4WU93_ARATH|nr:phytochrome C [Arabidopsis thaliana]AFI61904.1 phytochrome C [Arabidopsis thaliana]KAG7603970.1 PAS domain superfamily [Arabidopsis thaliana x Arabidopsis arenosa]OAO93772.1 PHYC [Arabidopsis thaliana]CAA83549.1 phyC [Arabidopsis thaliana]
MSSNTSRSYSTRSRQNSRVSSQVLVDAKLHGNFEESERLFDYSASINLNMPSSSCEIPSSAVSTYLQKIQRGMLIQPFGCLIVVDEKNLKVIAFSENTQEMLGLIPHTVPSMEQREALTIGTDVKSLFLSPGCSALQKAVDFGEISILNPITLHCRSSSKPFYAILHRIEEGLVIDLEPVSPDEVPVTAAGALRSYKLAAKSISRLQALPSGNMLLLCDALVKEVSELTSYDRVMVYKFHEDGHGEVIAECCREDMEPYLGLHYSATDIPQASRFLFMRNKVRMICDCSAVPVKVVQDKSLSQPISLSGSTLRAPHGCHAQYMSNMGSVASLVMSVTINGSDSDEMNRDLQTGRHLWGLVVCHHASPRFVPFPLRYACEFLTQVFGVQINKEAESAVLLKEKRILQTQSVLCDMLFRNAPIGIVTQSPNIMDLVKCDGAALYYRDKLWSLGVTPTETQIRDLIDWVLKSHGGNTGFTTESLMESGYPDASVLGESICGMAAVYITEKDFLFWFRSSTAKQIKWGGARHDPNDRDGKRMHPRSSFKAFMEIVRWKSVPWDDMEMDAINSLQLIIKGSLQEEHSKTVVDVPLVDNRVQKVDELCVIVNEMVRLIDTAAVPIFAVDASGVINGWNSKAAEVTGLAVEQAIGKPVSDLVEDDSVETVKNMLALALEGSEERGAEIRIRAFGPKRKSSPVELVVNTCCSRDMTNNVLGVCFIGQDVTGQKKLTENYSRVQGDYARIMWSPSTLIPPIFMTNENGVCSEWNNAMQKLSGIKREEVVNKILLGEVFTTDDYGCCLKDHDTLTKLRIGFNAVISGQKNIKKLLFGFYHRDGSFIEALLSANKRTDIEGKVTGVLCFLQVPSPELQYALQVQQISEHAIACALNKLAYLRHEVKDPEKAISFLQDLLHSSGLSEDQKRLLRTSVLCREQLAKVISDSDIEGIEEGYVELDCSEFGLQESLEAVVKQVMELSIERKVQISCDYPQEVSSMRLYGDNLRLQQILSETLLSSIRFTPAWKGLCVSFKVIARIEAIGKRMKRVELEFRIIHPAPGLPEDLVREMFQPLRKGTSREGLGLHITQKLVKLMERGTLRYLRESEMSAFVILTEFPLI